MSAKQSECAKMPGCTCATCSPFLGHLTLRPLLQQGGVEPPQRVRLQAQEQQRDHCCWAAKACLHVLRPLADAGCLQGICLQGGPPFQLLCTVQAAPGPYLRHTSQAQGCTT